MKKILEGILLRDNLNRHIVAIPSLFSVHICKKKLDINLI